MVVSERPGFWHGCTLCWIDVWALRITYGVLLFVLGKISSVIVTLLTSLNCFVKDRFASCTFQRWTALNPIAICAW